MTYSRPCRFTSLQFSQIRLTLARTFIARPPAGARTGPKNWQIAFIAAQRRPGKGDKAPRRAGACDLGLNASAKRR